MGRLTSIVQGTEEWHLARSGIVCSSEAKGLMILNAEKKPGSFGEGAKRYALEVAAARLGGLDEEFATMAMQRGSFLEEEALDEYEEQSWLECARKQFWLCDTMAFGCSPDAVVMYKGVRGTVEVKCMNRVKHADVLLNRRVPAEHVVQVQSTMWNTDASFCDFVSYHPGVRPDKRLCVVRVQRDTKFLATFTPRLLKFLDMVDGYAEQLGVSDWKPFANPGN
jgi:hypothetical protein